jgi:hypothetical protein
MAAEISEDWETARAYLAHTANDEPPTAREKKSTEVVPYFSDS